MQAAHGGGHVGGCHGGGFVQVGQVQTLNNYQQQNLYQQLLPVVRHVLQVVLENDFEESVEDVTRWILFEFKFNDGTDISQWMPPANQEAMMKGRVLEALAHWIRGRAQTLDTWVPVAQVGLRGNQGETICQHMQACIRKLDQSCYQSHNAEVMSEFIFLVVTEILGRDSACLASALGGMLASQVSRQELLEMAEWPPKLLALMVRKLEEIQAKVSKVVMEMYIDTGFLSADDSKHMLMMFFQFYTVETQGPAAGTLEVHMTEDDPAFRDSPFRVHLVDSFGCLTKLLLHIESIRGMNGNQVQLAVDFEGVKLNRHGALCLVQMTCSDDPRLVYVIDVHVLGRRAFTLTTSQGLSLKNLLEDEQVRKVWFDPRNDVDALFHQFHIVPRGIFDLQLAEVAHRRNRGLNVQFVQGLYKCLTQCPELQDEQKVFAEMINRLGKSLFEPQNGGDYAIFLERPLNPVILVYAAHDSRYMLVLYEQYTKSIGPGWVERVVRASAHPDRGGWWNNREYTMPSSEAPEF